MDAKAQLFVDNSRKLIEFVRPGIVARFERLGGEYGPVPIEPKTTKDRATRKVRSVQAGLSCVIPSKTVIINMKFTAFSEFGLWEIVQCAYHCGPSDALDDVHFRICDNEYQDFHFHLRGRGGEDRKDHIPAARARPSITREPRDFLAFVEKFLAEGTIPIEEAS